MKYEHLMTDVDWQDLHEIEAAVAFSKERRARLMNRLRQRAHRARAEVQRRMK